MIDITYKLINLCLKLINLINKKQLFCKKKKLKKKSFIKLKCTKRSFNANTHSKILPKNRF